MALLHHTDHVFPTTRTDGARLNWRMLLALGATAAFWAVVAQAMFHLFA